MTIFERYESNVRGYSRTWPVVFDKALKEPLNNSPLFAIIAASTIF